MFRPLWLPFVPFPIEFCIVLAAGFALACILTGFHAGKQQSIAAFGFVLGAVASILPLLSVLWAQEAELLCLASDLAWGPALGCLAWSALGIMPEFEKTITLSFLPLLAMLLYLFRLVIEPSPGRELIAIYGPVMAIPAIGAAFRGIKGVGLGHGLGGALLMLGWGAGWWLGRLIPGVPAEVEWAGLLLPLGAIVAGMGMEKIQQSCQLKLKYTPEFKGNRKKIEREEKIQVADFVANTVLPVPGGGNNSGHLVSATDGTG